MDGQLGHGEEKSSVPKVIEQFKELGAPSSLSTEKKSNHQTSPLKVGYIQSNKYLNQLFRRPISIQKLTFFVQVSSIKAGGMMSLAIDNLGALWIWGNSPQPSGTEEDNFSLVSSSSPLPVWDFHGHTVVKVACGNEHVVAAISAGEKFSGTDLVCYAWGNNSHGQLGLGDKAGRARPQAISAFDEDSPWAIYEISCGAFHTAVLTHKKSYEQEIESRCWTFGLGDNGQLGHGTTTSTSLPEPVDGLPLETILISLDCGLFHTSVLSASGEVWSWGMEKGLGLCPDASFVGDAGDALFPVRLRCHEEPEGLFPLPVQVACGAAHTILVAGDGDKLWAWGRGRSGVLGRGQTADSFVPAPLIWPSVDSGLKKEVLIQRSYESKASVHRTGGGSSETAADRKLSEAVEELSLLREKLTLMERYATVLHVSIFRKSLDESRLPQSLYDSGVFDVKRELENVMEDANIDELARLQMFYEGMLAAVKDKLMKRQIKEVVKEYMLSLSLGRQP